MVKCEKELGEISKLADEIAREIDGLLDGDEPEPTIFKKARRIERLAESCRR